MTKPYFIETVSFYAGTSEEVRLRGQLYAGGQKNVRIGIRSYRRYQIILYVRVRVACGPSLQRVVRYFIVGIYFIQIEKRELWVRLNDWRSTLQAAWYNRHVCLTCVFYISFIVWCLWTKPTIYLVVVNTQFHNFYRRWFARAVLSSWRIYW